MANWDSPPPTWRASTLRRHRSSWPWSMTTPWSTTAGLERCWRNSTLTRGARRSRVWCCRWTSAKASMGPAWRGTAGGRRCRSAMASRRIDCRRNQPRSSASPPRRRSSGAARSKRSVRFSILRLAATTKTSTWRCGCGPRAGRRGWFPRRVPVTPAPPPAATRVPRAWCGAIATPSSPGRSAGRSCRDCPSSCCATSSTLAARSSPARRRGQRPWSSAPPPDCCVCRPRFGAADS